MAQNDLNNKAAGPKFSPPAGRFGLLFFLIILAVFLFVLFSGTGVKNGAEISYTEFISRVSQGQVDSVKIVAQKEIHGVLRDVHNADGLFVTYIPYNDLTLMELLAANNVRVTGGEAVVSLWFYVLQFAPTLLAEPGTGQ
jgi:ATP-dependent Zn protease